MFQALEHNVTTAEVADDAGSYGDSSDCKQALFLCGDSPEHQGIHRIIGGFTGTSGVRRNIGRWAREILVSLFKRASFLRFSHQRDHI